MARLPLLMSAAGGSSINVNGSVVPAPNFNGTTPAAPGGDTNVIFQVTGSSISAYIPTTPPSGSVLWSALGNAAANLTLANAGYTTTFNQTSAVAWTWANTTAAVLATNQSSPSINLGGTYFGAAAGVLAASAVDTWSLQNVLAAPTQLSTTASITNIAENSGNTVTLTLVASTFVPGTVVELSGFGAGFGDWLNGYCVSLITATAVACTFTDPTGHGTLASHVTTGTPVMTQVSGLSTLAFTHNGSPISSKVQLPSATVLEWSTDTGISRLGAASLAIGNGTAGDVSGSLTLKTLTLTDTTNGTDLILSNTTPATVSTTNASPLLELAANYWTAGPASAADTWTIGSSLGVGTNAGSQLTIQHSGTNNSITTGVTIKGVCSATTGKNGALVVDNGNNNGNILTLTANSVNISYQCSNSSGYFGTTSNNPFVIFTNNSNGALILDAAGGGTFGAQTGTPGNGCLALTGALLAWTAGTNSGTKDTGISRLGAASLAIGSGTAGDTTGKLTLAQLILSATQSPASNAAGTAGELAYDSNYIYVCIASGTWKRAALTGGY